MNFDNWYKKEVELNQEYIPEDIWNNISLELDVDDTWKNISRELTTKLIYKRLRYVSVICLSLIISFTIFIKIQNKSTIGNICQSFQIENINPNKMPEGYLLSIYSKSIHKSVLYDNQLLAKIKNTIVSALNNYLSKETDSNDIITYKNDNYESLYSIKNELSIIKSTSKDNYIDLRTLAIENTNKIYFYSRFTGSIFEYVIFDESDSTYYPRFTSSLFDIKINLPKGFFFGLSSSIFDSKQNNNFQPVSNSNKFGKKFDLIIGYNLYEKYEFAIEGSWSSNNEYIFSETQNGIVNNYSFNTSNQNYNIITKIKSPFYLLGKVPATGNIVIGAGIGTINNHISNSSVIKNTNFDFNYHYYSLIVGYEYDFYVYKNLGFNIGARSTYTINEINTNSQNLPSNYSYTSGLSFGLIIGLKYTPKW